MSGTVDEPGIADLYEPIEGGWQIWITRNEQAPRLEPGSRIGVVAPLPGSSGHEHNPEMEKRRPQDDPRRHRRPLFPPADRSLLWDRGQLEQFRRTSFRPLVLAYNAPRFVFDFHFAGGLLGHLRLGYVPRGEAGKWLDAWSDLLVRYVDGRMEYRLRDPAFPGAQIRLSAAPLAGAVGLALRYQVTGTGPASLVWYYGGASAFFSNYAFGAAAFDFAPEQCSRDLIQWRDSAFALRRSFAPGDSIMEQGCAVPRLLPGWAALVRGGGSAPAPRGLGEPAAAMAAPADLRRGTEFLPDGTSDERLGGLAVQDISLSAGQQEGYLVVGAGGNVEEAIRAPESAYQAALARQASIAGRVVARTPDPYLDAAARMMAFALEGTWGDTAYLHGGWSWRYAYLGWRNWYGPACYGWTGRVAQSIRNHLALGKVAEGEDRGALGATLEFGPGVYYNMNEVFLDHVRQYFEYTGDLELMRAIFPSLKEIVAWENRRLQPGNEYLYESSLNTWISDSHWNIRGQCAQASAYMLGAHRFLAELAGRLGESPAAFAEAADRIRAAMQRRLWQPGQGVFADYRDTTGHGLLHPEPELPTLYHAAEFGAATPLQIGEMLHWADTRLEQVGTAGGGKLYWSSNWHPNNGHSYTHSTYEMAYAEELNFALTQYLGGRAEEGYALIRATLCGIFNGPTPGGLACHAYVDGRQRANDEFADAISMWGRALVEGLFGIVPRQPDRLVRLCPQFPSAWPEAAIRTPHFSYTWKRREGMESIAWEAPSETAVRLRLPLRASAIHQVRLDGLPAACRVEPGVGLTWLRVESGAGRKGTIEVEYAPAEIALPAEKRVESGAEFALDLAAAGAVDFLNPQAVLQNARVEAGILRGTITDESGPGLLFLLAGATSCPVWVPIRLRVERTGVPPRLWSPPRVGQDLGNWTLIDLRPVFNAALTQVLERVAAAARPPAPPASQIGFGYRNEHLTARQKPVSDAAWRAKVGAEGIAWTADGIPFRTCREGPNIGVVTRAGGFPVRLGFPVRAAGRTLYLMLSGMTFPAQSHVANLRVEVVYAGGRVESTDLANPSGIGDCWGTWLGRFHDTPANGFENLGGRFGPAGSAEVADPNRPVAVDTEAHLVAIPLRSGLQVDHLWLEAVANDAIFGVMGASVLK
jgi:hypothetical protein